MLDKRTWRSFRETGLLWWINTQLHMFGWAIAYEQNGKGEITHVYPARVRFRGFGQKQTEEGYRKVSTYLKENIEKLEKEAYE